MVMNPIELEVKESYASVARNMLEGKNDTCCSAPVVSGEECCTSATDSSPRAKESLGCDIRLLDVAAPQKNEVVIDL